MGLRNDGRRTLVTVRPAIWVGIDVGKTKHHACAMDSNGKVLFSKKVTNDQASIEQLLARAGEAAAEVRWAIDLTSNAAALLTAVLLTSGHHVVYVPGRVVNRMTGAFHGESKTDAKDAKVIANTARLRADFAPVTATDDLVVELARLTTHREDLMTDWVRGVNRLPDLLIGIFPPLKGPSTTRPVPHWSYSPDFKPPTESGPPAKSLWRPTCANTAPGPRASPRWLRPRWRRPEARPRDCRVSRLPPCSSLA
jgi:hypothetical protein